jgi:hypothetical protein
MRILATSLAPVLQIRVFWYGSGSDLGFGSCYFLSVTFKITKNDFVSQFICLLLIEVLFSSFIKDKGHKEVTKQ